MTNPRWRMPHSHAIDTTRRRRDLTSRPGRNEAARHQRALRILVVVLIPLGIWTFAGLIALWPSDAASHVNADVAGYSIAGVSYPTAEITAIQPVSCEGMAGSTPGVSNQTCATIAVRVLDGEDTGKEVAGIPLTDALYNSGTEVGQRVTLIRIPPLDGQPAQYQFSDFERRTPLLVITLVFAAAVIFVARWRGFAALLGLGFAGFILVKFMFPALVSGSNPLLVGLVGSSAIMFVVLYAAHGFSARTSTALVGTLFGLVTAALLGWGATNWAHLTGVTAEDDYVLAAAAPDLSLTSVVLVGIIVAGLGVLNDVTITQASAVWELADDDPDQKRLFSKAMRIGRDHIASTVYTIAFATAGASLPVLLLIAIYNRPLWQVLQTEQFAAELIRTMIGSIGLILAVPLTTAIGVAVVRASRTSKPSRAPKAASASGPRQFPSMDEDSVPSAAAAHDASSVDGNSPSPESTAGSPAAEGASSADGTHGRCRGRRRDHRAAQAAHPAPTSYPGEGRRLQLLRPARPGLTPCSRSATPATARRPSWSRCPPPSVPTTASSSTSWPPGSAARTGTPGGAMTRSRSLTCRVTSWPGWSARSVGTSQTSASAIWSPRPSSTAAGCASSASAATHRSVPPRPSPGSPTTARSPSRSPCTRPTRTWSGCPRAWTPSSRPRSGAASRPRTVPSPPTDGSARVTGSRCTAAAASGCPSSRSPGRSGPA